MLNIKRFVFNPFQENTFVLSDDNGACVIMDPGCNNASERQELSRFVEENNLNVELLLNTHGHVDHIMGNKYVKDQWKVPFVTHEAVVPALERGPTYAPLFGVSMEPSPMPDQFVGDGDTVTFGDIQLEVLFVPGHSSGHIAFFHRESKNLFAGDVLFYGSIGRTDLPGGSYEVLMQSITQKLLPLGDEVKVHCGHGPSTSIGDERRTNPFILDYFRRTGNPDVAC